VLHSDPEVLGKSVRLGTRSATVVGVLEPSVPYPSETEVIANVVTSPHHLSATMVQGRLHRMTELFGRLAPEATLAEAQAELRVAHASMVRQHPEAYSAKGEVRITAVTLRDQITSRARPVLLVLLAASVLLFIIACSNVANLVLARTVRRESELAMRHALGASTGALRRTLLAESLLLCGAGAVGGVLIAQPLVAILARYAARFSVRALDLTVDAGLLWSGVVLALVAALLLAFVPRLPSSGIPTGLRITSSTTSRLRFFAATQIAASFVLLVGAAMLLKTLLALQSVETGLDTPHVLALNVPVMSYGRTPEQIVSFYRETMRRVAALPNVNHVAIGTQIPWRDAGSFGPGFQFSADGHVSAPGEEDPRAYFRTVSPGFFAALGVPLVAGRDFNDLDRPGAEPVVIVSQSLARRMFPNQDALNRHLQWTDVYMKFIGVGLQSRRIVGVVPDVDDENVVPGPSLTVYQPFGQEQPRAGRLFVNANQPYALVAPIRRIIHDLSADQPAERAATLADIRAEILTPDRLNTLLFGGFAVLALTIAVVGVAGVLAFSVSVRTREFGIRLALGSEPRQLVADVVVQGAAIAAAGIASGAAGGFALAKLAGSYFHALRMPGPVVLVASAVLLLSAALAAALLPALRASRVDVIQALRSE
jgi:predicted permease